ncbi:MAG: glycosyltransferase family 4 protein, partial [Veillonellaceae bacterium]|nr:glycosyltransferase family 4 protein [Veillonellaceae bacterium]
MKVGIHLGGVRNGHEVRGVGVHTGELLRALKSLPKKDELLIEEYNPQGKYDLVHFTVFKPFVLSIPFVKPAPKVFLTIHDLIPLLYPKHYPGGLRGNLILMIQKWLVKRNIDVIITISETSKKDICRLLKISPDLVHVIRLAPRKIFRKLENGGWKKEIKKKYKLPERFVLYVGDVNYNKNIPNLVKACEIAGTPLVIVGKQAAEIETMNLNHSELRHLKSVDFSSVIRLGFVSDNDLVAIYNLATVVVQPSYYEGFGLPVLEALACGCSVAVSRIQAHV